MSIVFLVNEGGMMYCKFSELVNESDLSNYILVP